MYVSSAQTVRIKARASSKIFLNLRKSVVILRQRTLSSFVSAMRVLVFKSLTRLKPTMPAELSVRCKQTVKHSVMKSWLSGCTLEVRTTFPSATLSRPNSSDIDSSHPRLGSCFVLRFLTRRSASLDSVVATDEEPASIGRTMFAGYDPRY